MRFHVVALPHTATNKQYSHCAYTQKVLNFCRMMRSLGHAVFHYGTEGSHVDCDEDVVVLSTQEQEQFFGAVSPNHLPPAKFEWSQPYWVLMNKRAAAEILRRLEPGDFLCLIAGLAQQPIADAVGESKSITVEYGVGYYGVFCKFRVFESYTHQSAVYASLKPYDPDGSLYDAVIPNSYDPEDFPFIMEPRDYYLLYLARVLRRKGILTAVEIARAAQMPLTVAGQGVAAFNENSLYTEEGIAIHHNGEINYVGSVQPAQRAHLMGHARALLQPTVFMEPFGGNVVEAQFCGTPSITVDYAAFSETVRHGVNGYRCHTLEQFVWAANAVEELNPGVIHHIADSNYSIWRVRDMYQEYFDQLHDLWGAGWPTLRPRKQLDWLNKL